MFTVSFDTLAVFELLFYIAALVFIIHTVILSYHWLSYGADRKQSWIGITVHLGVGSALILTMAIALLYI
jgi:hypothetical protein